MMPRHATTADIAGILALWNPLIRNTAVTFNSVEKTPDEMAEILVEKAKAGHAFFVVGDVGTVLGFGGYGQFRTGAGYANTMEHSILLAPAARGQGAGRALMAAIEGHARAGGALSMIAGVSAENPAGRAFHAAVGYTEIATLPRVGFKFGRWMDLHLMQKFLT